MLNSRIITLLSPLINWLTRGGQNITALKVSITSWVSGMRSALSNGEAYIYKTGDKNDVSL